MRSGTQVRVLGTSIVLCVCLVVIGCGGPTSAAKSSSSSPAGNSTTSGTTTSLHLAENQAANVGGIWKVAAGPSFYFTSARQEHIAAVLVKVTNASSASQKVDPSNWTLTDSSGKTYDAMTGATLSVSGHDSLAAGSLAPGQSASGLVAFLVPASGRFTVVLTSGSSTASWDITVS